MSATDAVRVSTIVVVDPAAAFRVFTEEIDAWWLREPRFRRNGERRLCFEPAPDGGADGFRGAGGRLVAYRESGDVFEVGRVLVWQPPERLVFEWRAGNFEPGQATLVEVRFEPSGNGTRVTLEHRGFDALPAGHPVRHGLEGGGFLDLFGVWWAELLASLRALAAARVPEAR